MLCGEKLARRKLHDAKKNIPSNKSLGNNGFTKDFYLSFWDDVKDTQMRSAEAAGSKKGLSISQRQEIIKLIENIVKDERFIKNWQLILL